MAGQLTLDTSGFGQAMQEYLKFTRKTCAEALNAKAGDVAYRAEAFTTSANPAEIDAKLGKLVGGKMLASGKYSRSKKYPRTFQPTRWVYHIINYFRRTGKNIGFGVLPKWLVENVGMGPPLVGAEMAAVARSYWAAKKRSIHYIGLGWLMTARFFGKQVSVAKISPKGWAYHSDGIKATPTNLTATLRNFSRDAGTDEVIARAHIREALETAMQSVEDDMWEWIIDRMMKQWLKQK